MAQLVPYLNFAGNCREAMAFYQRCLGGKLTSMTFGESPMAGQVPADHHNHILHSMLAADNITLMASDLMPGATMPQDGPVTLALTSRDKDEIRALFNTFAAGGNVTMPLDEAFFGLYGEVTDQFGIRWLFQAGQN